MGMNQTNNTTENRFRRAIARVDERFAMSGYECRAEDRHHTV